MALNHPFELDFWCLSLERHFEARTVKLSVKLITSQNMAKLQYTVRPLKIIVFSWFSGAYL